MVARQVLFCRENSAACVPVNVVLLTETATLGLTFFTVTVMGLLLVFSNWLAKAIGDGVMLMYVPMPLRGTLCEPAPALSEIVRVAVRELLALGVKVTEIVHDAPGLIAPTQVVVLYAKSLASAPVIVMPVISSAAVPVLVTLTVFGLLVVRYSWLVKASFVGDRVAIGVPVLPW